MVRSRYAEPVMLPPGWARLRTKPWSTGSVGFDDDRKAELGSGDRVQRLS
jgi:hypothetical protein